MTDEPAGVLLLDDDRVFVAANEEAATLLGTTADELIGRQADEFMPLVARSLYPLAWKGFLLRGSAHGDYAARLADESLRHLAYVGFANRPIRGLHFFVVVGLEGDIDAAALLPREKGGHVQVGPDLPAGLRERLVREADRQEWRLPIAKGAERAVFAALFNTPRPALEVLESIRSALPVEASVASAAGSTPSSELTLLAGRVPYSVLGVVLAAIRDAGGRIMANVDERRTR